MDHAPRAGSCTARNEMGLSSFVKRSDKRKYHGPSASQAAKKKAQQTAKEKKAIKQQKKHAGEAVPPIRH